MKKLVIGSLLLSLISCGTKSDDSQETQNSNAVKIISAPESAGYSLPDGASQSMKEAFLLKSTTSDKTLKAVFYDDDGQAIRASGLNKGGPGFYPFGANSVRIYTGEKLEKVLIFTCCGNIFGNIKTEREDENIWKVTGFSVVNDSKSPMIFTVNGEDYYLKSPLKEGLKGIRSGFSDAVLDITSALNLDIEDKNMIESRLNKVLLENLGFKMEKAEKPQGEAK